MPEADLLLLLLKNLPEQVRSFVLHHASGESYMAYRSAARNYEERQRLFGDPKFGKQVNQIFGQTNPQQVEETPWNEHDGLETGINAVGQEGKCSKCGSRKHTSQECTTDFCQSPLFQVQCVWAHRCQLFPRKEAEFFWFHRFWKREEF